MSAHPGSSIGSCVTLGKSHNLAGSCKSHLKRLPTLMAGPASRKCGLVYPMKVGLALHTTFYFYCRLIFPFFTNVRQGMDFRSQPTFSYQVFQNSEETCPPREHRWGAAHFDSSSPNTQMAKPSAVNREILFSEIPAWNPSTLSARVNLFSRSLSIFFSFQPSSFRWSETS